MFVDGPNPPTPMVTVWNIPADGTEVVLPLTSDGTYNCTVDWGDGTTTFGTAWDGSWARHTYAEAGTYTVKLSGSATHWSFNNTGSKDLLIEVTKLGNLGWTNFHGAFYGCSNLVEVRGGDVALVTDMAYMFADAPFAVPYTGDWDVGNVTTMAYMFYNAAAANPDVQFWDVGNVTNMELMFNAAVAANPDVTNWNMQSVTTIAGMFAGATIATPNTSNWTFVHLTNTALAFSNTDYANPDVSTWDMAEVTDISYMFYNAKAATPDTSAWDTGSVTDMSFAFALATLANPDVSKWLVTNVVSMSGMFYKNAVATPDTFMWRTNNLTTAAFMFQDAILANPSTYYWDMSKVTSIAFMFSGAASANPVTSSWVTTALQEASGAFSSMPSMTNSVSASAFWDNAGITLHEDCFSGSLNISNYGDIPSDWGGGAGFRVRVTISEIGQRLKFKIDNPVDLVVRWGDGTSNTYNATGYASREYVGTGTFTVSISGTATRIAFGDVGSTPTLIVEVLNSLAAVTGITSCKDMFNGCTNLDTVADDFFTAASANVTDVSGMFKGTSALTTLITALWDMSAVTDMSSMFESSAITTFDTSSWNTGAVTTMARMFFATVHANPVTTNWNVGNVTDMSYMFYATHAANPNTATWDVSKVTTFYAMFSQAQLANPNTASWVTTALTNCAHMFNSALVANPDVSGWDMSGVTTIASMFASALAANPDTSAWDTSSVTDMSSAFYNLTTLVRTMTAAKFWENATVVTYTDCFSGAVNVVNYEDIPYAWGGPVEAFKVQVVVDEGAEGLGYEFYSDHPNALVVLWGDGSSDAYTSAADDVAMSHVYAAAGTYDIKIRGSATRIAFDASISNDIHKLRKVLTDINNISGITSCDYMFKYNVELSEIVSGFLDSTSVNVTSMRGMFYNASLANPVTTNWDTSNVTDMAYMFHGAAVATPDTTTWNTSKVTTFLSMFRSAALANPVTTSWDTGSATSMVDMFKDATTANPNVASWSMASVLDISGMFYGATSANPDISSWVTSAMHTCNDAFRDCSAFARTITASQFWESSTTGSIDHLNCFTGSSAIVNRGDIPLDWGGDAGWAFTVSIPDGDAATRTYGFTADLDQYGIDWGDGTVERVASVGDVLVSHVYAAAGTYTVKLAAYNTTHFAFYNTKGYYSKVTSVATSMNPWMRATSTTSLAMLFYRCANIVTIHADFFDFTGLTISDMSYMFAVSNLNPDLSALPTGAVTLMHRMFKQNTDATPDTTNWDVGLVTNMMSMFEGATSANPVTTNWNTSKVKYMNRMFKDCSANPNVSKWDVSCVETFAYMFANNAVANPDISKWVTCSVTDTSYMFDSTTAANPDISNLDTSNVTTAAYMFHDAAGFTRTIPPYLFWERAVAFTDSTACFDGATNATNYNDIPSAWGGTKTDWLLTVDVPADGDKLAFHYTNATITVDWGDGTVTDYTGSGNLLRAYTTAGTYQIKIHGTATSVTFSRDGYDGTGYADAQVVSIDNAITNALSITSASLMFTYCTQLSSIYQYFFDAVSGGITTTYYMFDHATLANPDVSRWDLSNVTTMTKMFYYATTMNKVIPAKQFWSNPSSPTHTNCFTGAAAVSNRSSIPAAWGGDNTNDTTFNIEVVTDSMNRVFKIYANGCNLTISWGDSSMSTLVGAGDTSKTHTYATAGTYTVKISGSATRIWFYQSSSDAASASYITAIRTPLSNVSGISSTQRMLAHCYNLAFVVTDFLDVVSSDLTDMSYMFDGNTCGLSIYSNNWDVSNVTNMSNFAASSNITLNTDNWDTSGVTSFYYAFYNNTAVNPNIRGIYTNAASDVRGMFYGATALNCIAPSKRFWNRAWPPIANYTSCFKNASNVVNYANIPSAWKA